MATTTAINETGNTDFAIRKGKLQIRLEWFFRVLMLLLIGLTNAGLWLNQRLVTNETFERHVVEVSRRIEDHETRLRELEKRIP